MIRRFEQRMRVRDADHGVVYRNNAEFCGWPFVSGFWTTAQGHHVVAFMKKPSTYREASEVNHDEVALVGPQMVTLRSRDGGYTWDPNSMRLLFDLSADQNAMFAKARTDYADMPRIDFTNRDVLVASGGTPDYFRPHSRAWIRVSTDGGDSWRPPLLAPNLGWPSLSGHASALVRPDGVSLVFLTAVGADGWGRRPVVYASVDDGTYWTFLSVITSKHDDGAADGDRNVPLRFGPHRYFYPRGITLPDGRILLSLRCQRDPTSLLWTEIFQSDDGGLTWRFLSRVNDWGAPGDLVRLADGRIACVYGYRLAPFGVRVRYSEDDGRSWGREWVLRDDGGSWDLGYPRVAEIAPSKLMCVYYMNTKDDPIQLNGGVRHIARSVFSAE